MCFIYKEDTLKSTRTVPNLEPHLLYASFCGGIMIHAKD